MIELRKIYHIVEIARQRSFTKAAVTLNISQSALTKSVQSVEERLEFLLFDRGPRGITLTSEGEWFVERGNHLLADAEELEGGVRATRELNIGRLRLGTAPATLDLLWMDALPAFAGAYPGIHIITMADSVANIASLLSRGELDMALGSFSSLKDDPKFEVTDFDVAPVEVYVRRGHPLDKTTPPSMRDLFSYALAGPIPPEPHMSIIRKLAFENDSPYTQPQILVDSFQVTTRLVECTNAFAFVFSHHSETPAFKQRFRTWPNWQILPPLSVHIAYRRGWRPTRAAARFLEFLERSKGSVKL